MGSKTKTWDILLLVTSIIVILLGVPFFWNGNDVPMGLTNRKVATITEREEEPLKPYSPQTRALLFDSPPAQIVNPVTTAMIIAPVVEIKTDSTSLSYVGTMTTAENNERFFFKDKRSGIILTLQLGEAMDGWVLKSLEDKKFKLEGPGGLYEVKR